MQMRTLLLTVISGLLITVISSAQPDPGMETAQDRFLVRLSKTVHSDQVSQALSQYNLVVEKSYSIVPNLYLVRMAGTDKDRVNDQRNPSKVREFMQTVQQDESVHFIEPDYIVHENIIPDDPGFPGLYGLHNTGQTGGTVDADIDAPEAWDITTGDSIIIVGVIDSGIDYNHPDLAANMWKNVHEIPGNNKDDDGNGYVDDIYGYDFAYYDSDPSDYRGHGTHCAGTIAAAGNNSLGVTGVAWNVKLMACKFLNDEGYGYVSDAVYALEYAKMMGAHITNNSWGGGGYSAAMHLAIANSGMLFVASAGNESSDNDIYPAYPASYQLNNVISVAANYHDDLLAPFSNWGLTSVDLTAPGMYILSTKPDNPTSIQFGTPGWGLDPMYYGKISGTSMAAPHVSGAAALLYSWIPNADPVEVKNLLLANVDVLPHLADKLVTSGRLNIYKAVQEVTDALLVSADTLDFGIVGVTERDSMDIIIRNFTDSEANLSLSVSNPDFKLSRSHGIIDVQEHFVVNVIFAPSFISFYQADLVIETADTSFTISLLGAGEYLPFIRSDIPSLTFNLNLEDSSASQLILSNTGLADLHWSLPGLLGVDPVPRVYPASFYHQTLQKGDEDPRQGIKVESHHGGPDTEGYQWIDSDVESGLQFKWIEISETGTEVTGLGDDQFKGPFPIGFSFKYYDETYTEFYIASNGLIGFGPTLQYETPNNDPLPRANYPNNVLAFLWDDWIPQTGQIYYQSEAGELVIQFTGIQQYGSTAVSTCQVIISINGSITYQYLDFSDNFDLTQCTVGIENRDGSSGLEVVFNQEYLHDSLAVQFSKINWLKAGPNRGVLNPGTSQTIDIAASSNNLIASTYHTYLAIANNDQDKNPFEIPILLTVNAQLLTFSVDLTHYINKNLFRPQNGDHINIVGSFNEWKPDELVTFSDQGNGIYQAEIPLYKTAGDTIEYQYQLFAGDGRILYQGGKEDSLETPTGYRQFILTGQDAVMPVVFFNDNHSGFPGIVFLPDSLHTSIIEKDSSEILASIQNAGSSDLIWSVSLKSQSQSMALLEQGAYSTEPWLGSDFIPKKQMGDIHDWITRFITVYRQGFYDDFETGYLYQWTQDDISYHNYEITDETAAQGLYSMKLTGESTIFDDGVYAKFLDTVPSTISFYVYPTSLDRHAFVYIGGDDLSTDNAFFKFASYQSNFHINTGQEANLLIPHELDRWYHIELCNIDFTHQIFDLFIDGVMIKSNCSFAATGFTSVNTILIFNYDYFTTSYFDDIYIDALPLQPWLTFAPDTGHVAPDSSQAVHIQMNAENLKLGTYLRDLFVQSNDPSTPSLTVPLQLSVTMKDPPQIVVDPDSLAFVLLEGDSLEKTLTIQNKGTRDLEWNLAYSLTRIYPPSLDVQPLKTTETQDSEDSLAVPLVNISEESGILKPDSSDHIAVQVNAYSEKFSQYQLNIMITSNDPVRSAVMVPGQISILMIDPPVMVILQDSLEISLTRNDSTQTRFSLENTGIRDLNWLIAPQDQQSETAIYTLSVPNDSIIVYEAGAEQSGADPIRTCSIDGEFENLKNVKILYDRSHGQSDYYRWSTIIMDLLLRGAIVNQNQDSLSLELLNNYDILWITDLTLPFVASEIQIIRTWVASGGHLLLEGDEDLSILTYNHILHPLYCGIQYHEEEGASNETRNIRTHEITRDVMQIYLSDNSAHLSTVDAPAKWLIKDTDGLVNTAYSFSGKGRIAAMADEVTDDYHIGYADNQVFANQLFDWLVKGTREWVTVTPDSGSIVTGSSHDIKLKIQTDELVDSLYRSNLIIQTNDPEKLTCLIPIRLELDQIRPPEISVSVDSLDIVHSEHDTLTESFIIQNTGDQDLSWSVSLFDPGLLSQSESCSWSSLSLNTTPDVTDNTLDPDSLKTHLDILAWTPYADMNEDFSHIEQIIQDKLPATRMNTTITIQGNFLDSLLRGKDVFLIPEQERAPGLDFSGIADAWSPILQAFVQDGGVVICCAMDEHVMSLVTDTHLMDIDYVKRVKTGMLARRRDPYFLIQNIKDSLSLYNSTMLYTTSHPDVQVLLSNEEGAALLSRQIGNGYVIAMGFDFFEYDTNSAQILVNALSSQTLSQWLHVEPSFGVLPGDSIVQIQMKIFANLLQDGIHQKWLFIQHNDFMEGRLMIPVQVQLSETASLLNEQHLALPSTYKLQQNYPNPFNPVTSIRYQIPKKGSVMLFIFNILGRRTRVLVDEKQEPGYYHILWDATNDAGHRVSTGVYMIVMKCEGFMDVKKMLLLK